MITYKDALLLLRIIKAAKTCKKIQDLTIQDFATLTKIENELQHKIKNQEIENV